jgi:hypothetical protein
VRLASQQGRRPLRRDSLGSKAMKYVAHVDRRLHPGIHKHAEIGDVHPVADMPPAARVEIECPDGPSRPCMMYRYSAVGEFCGDTWHATLEDAYHQAAFEYGLSSADFRQTTSDG